VVGGGPTGVEAASEFAEQHPSAEVTLVSAGPLLAGMRAAARSAISRRLRRLGVAVLEDVAVLELESGKAHLSDGPPLAFDACVLATSFTVPGLAAASGLPVDPRGRLVVDDFLRSVSCPSIVGAGDGVAVVGPAGARLRMACSVALPMGGHAAGVLLSALRDEPPRPFSMGFSAQCISLGRRHGYIQLVDPDDSPRRLHVGGVPGRQDQGSGVPPGAGGAHQGERPSRLVHLEARSAPGSAVTVRAARPQQSSTSGCRQRQVIRGRRLTSPD
jgi:NADH dehydrogenase FAD-containing subunit